MPSVSATLPTAADKEIVKKFIPKSSNKIFMATVARLYVAYPDQNAWTYSNIVGAVVFSIDLKKNSLFFRIVDLLNDGGVVWEQELYENFSYNKEKPFFHTFTTDDYLAAFSFANENEADVFFSKVMKHISKKAKQQKEQKPKKKDKNGKITTSMISQPTDFRHLGHIGWNSESGYDAQNIDPKWKDFLNSLGDLVPPSVIEKNSDFIRDFVEKNGGIKKTAPPPSRSPTSKKVPPTPPPPKQKRPVPIKSKEKPPPPPVPARKSVVAPSISAEDSPPLHPPPVVPRKSVPSSPSLPPRQVQPSSPSLPPKQVQLRQVPTPQPPILQNIKQPSPPVAPVIPSIPKSRQPSPPPVVPSIPKSRQPSPPPVVPSIPKSRQPSPPPASVIPSAPKPRQPSPPPVQVVPPPPPPPVRTAPPPLPPARVVPSHNKQEVREVSPSPPTRITQTEVSLPPPHPSSSSGGPPPPPPPPPSSSVGPPPPPPPPPSSSGGLPPPSPPQPSGSNGRANLLAQIRNVGGVSGAGLKSVSQTPPSRQSTLSEEPSSPTSGGNDLLKTLANALMNRQQALNDYSDEEEDDDEEWGDDE